MPRLTAQDRRNLLVDAAFTVMVRDGVAAATTRAICAEAGMAQSVFHYAFPSKDALLEQLAESVVNTQTLALDGLDDVAGSMSLEDLVTAALDSVLDAAVADPGRQLVLYELALRDLRVGSDPGSVARAQYALYTARTDAFLAVVTERYRLSWTVPRLTVARMIATAIDGTLLNWLADRDTAAARGSLHILAAALLALVAAGS